ncbi:MAG: c-type cytochrome [Planctomycetia bacterium]|nr:c-type cytochrome [Planctomycetia bacterium]
MMRRWMLAALFALANGIAALPIGVGPFSPCAGAEGAEFAFPHGDLAAVKIDSDPKESFLAVQAAATGRLFVGGREALFVYEPDEKSQTGYGRRRELLRFPDHTWIYDIAIRGPDVYVLTVSALYVVPNAVTATAGEKLTPRRLVWGVPLGHVHQCFHGMTIGPEGDIYFAMGDPLWYYGDFNRPDHWGHWTFFSQPEGTATPYNGVGGVFRCRPDGSRFQIVARGLRNSCGLCFDRSFNLFTSDNDHEGMPSEYVPGRLLYVTPHTYFSWPRGWMLSKTPDRADLLQDLFQGMGRAVPVGQAYYDETFLPGKYRHNLLIARWCIRAVTRYPIEPAGDTFKLTEDKFMETRDIARPVSVCVGRGGRVFATIAYMAHNEGSPVYPSDLVMITRKDDSKPFVFRGYDALTATEEKLWAELSSPSFAERCRAHVEILRRGGAMLGEAAGRLEKAKADDPARTHLVWIAAAGKTAKGGEILRSLAAGKDDNLRLQAMRALVEFPELAGDAAVRKKFFVGGLTDGNPQVRHAALLGLFGCEGPVPKEVTSGPAREDGTYVRQAATILLAEKADVATLRALCIDSDVRTRLAGVLAIGFRLTLPPASERLPNELKLDPGRGGDTVIQFADRQIDLKEHGPVGYYTVAELWKAAPHSLDQETLFMVLADRLNDRDERVRLQAAHFLSLMNDPRSEPMVAQVRRASEERRLQAAAVKGVTQVWTAGPFDDAGRGFETIHEPEKGPIELAVKYDTPGGSVEWREERFERIVNFRKIYGDCAGKSFYAYFRLESGSRQRINLLLGSDDGVRVWINGRIAWTNDISRGALPFQDVVPVELEAGTSDVLVRVRNVDDACGLYLHFRSLQEVVARLPEKIELETLAERLRSASGPVKYGREFQLDWAAAVKNDGNAQQGRKLFEALSCVKCHATSTTAASGGGGGGAGGPSLAEAARRFTVPDLVQSILLPSRQVSPVFRATAIQTKDGLSLTGLVVGETGEKLELLLQDGKRETIAKENIEARQLVEKSPMPEGVIKKPEELRDILAYLLESRL